MEHTEQFYIGGKWVDPVSRNTLDVVDPATEEVIATIAIGDADDVDAAVAAARDAFESYSQTSREERLELFDRIIEGYKLRWAEIGDLISRRWAPRRRSPSAPRPEPATPTSPPCAPPSPTSSSSGRSARRCSVREPVGVCGLITPWNWPMNQSRARSPRRSPPAARWC